MVIVTGEAASPVVRSISAEYEEDITFKPLGTVSPKEIAFLLMDDEALVSFMKEHGPEAAVRALSDHETDQGVDCHQRAHVLGRFAYEEFGARAFSLMGHECHSGGYHGATEAFFHTYGTTDLESNISLICSDSLNSFFRHQCVRGIGHGIMAWTNYQLHDALGACDRLSAGQDQASCYSGIFMENVVGGLSGSMGHFTEYLSDDPHYPCKILEDKYLGACYFYQTSHMLQLFEGDFQKVGQACDTIPQPIQYLCFNSMGRDVGSASRGDPQRAIGLCSKVSEEQNRRHCLSGAVQDWFWDAGGADDALSFCKALDKEEDKMTCYTTIIRRAEELLLNPSDFGRFCAHIEQGYRQSCR